MSERPNIDCKELKKIIEKLHFDSRFEHLEDDEVRRIFPDVVQDRDLDLSEPGALFFITYGEQERIAEVIDPIKFRKLRVYYDENCSED